MYPRRSFSLFLLIRLLLSIMLSKIVISVKSFSLFLLIRTHHAWLSTFHRHDRVVSFSLFLLIQVERLTEHITNLTEQFEDSFSLFLLIRTFLKPHGLFDSLTFSTLSFSLFLLIRASNKDYEKVIYEIIDRIFQSFLIDS